MNINDANRNPAYLKSQTFLPEYQNKEFSTSTLAAHCADAFDRHKLQYSFETDEDCAT